MMWRTKLVSLTIVFGAIIGIEATRRHVIEIEQKRKLDQSILTPVARMHRLQKVSESSICENAVSANRPNANQFEADPEDRLTSNRSDEPFAKRFSLELAVQFMDAASQGWQDRRNCVTCHTNGLYLVGQSMLRRPRSKSAPSRKFAEAYVDDFVANRRKQSGQFGAIEGLVSTTAMLAIGERLSGNPLPPSTKRGLDFVLAKQEPTGEWKNWLKCDWPPFEHDDHFGVSLMAVALAMANKEYRQTPAVKLGMQRLEQFLKANPPINAHQKGMLLWAARYNDKLVTQKQETLWKHELLELQRDDGGWSLLSLGDESWKRAGNGKIQDSKSDAYGTGFAVFVLRQAGVQANDPTILRGIEWLKSHQRASGRWFVRSLKIRDRPSKNYISHAGTTFAIMALIECGHQLEKRQNK